MKLKVFIVLYLILLHYYWDITAGTNALHLGEKHGGFYNLLSDGFLSGHSYLPVEPHPALSKLQDPYDPAQNGPYRLHDATLYKGKYYSYFGPTPSIVLYIPYRLITKLYMGDHVSVLLFSFGGVIFAALLLLYLRNRYFNKINEWLILISILILGLANCSLYNLRRTDVYEVAISCGMFFLIGAVYFLCIAFKNIKPSFLMFSLSSLFIGLGIGARPQILFSGILLAITFLKVYKEFNDKETRIKSLISLFLPYALCILAICLYNYFRFDNPFNFGNKYQLAGIHMKNFQVLDLECLIPGSYLYLFHPPTINSTFPFVHIISEVPENLRPRVPYFLEKTIGIFPSVPFLLVMFFAPIYYWYIKLRDCKEKCKKDSVLQFSIIILIAFLISINLFVFLFQGLTNIKFIDVAVTVLDKLSSLSAIALIPIFIMIFIANIIIWLKKAALSCKSDCLIEYKFPVFEFLIVTIPGLINLFFILTTRGVTMRYEQDFLIFLILTTCIVWFYFDLLFTPHILRRKILRSISVSLGILSILFGMAFGIVGCYTGLKEENLEEFEKTKASFGVVSDLIHSIAPMWGQY